MKKLFLLILSSVAANTFADITEIVDRIINIGKAGQEGSEAVAVPGGEYDVVLQKGRIGLASGDKHLGTLNGQKIILRESSSGGIGGNVITVEGFTLKPGVYKVVAQRPGMVGLLEGAQKLGSVSGTGYTYYLVPTGMVGSAKPPRIK